MHNALTVKHWHFVIVQDSVIEYPFTLAKAILQIPRYLPLVIHCQRYPRRVAACTANKIYLTHLPAPRAVAIPSRTEY